MNIKRIPETQGWMQRVGEWAIRQRTFMPRMIDLEDSRLCNLKCPNCMRSAESSLCHNEEKLCSLGRFKEIYEEIPTLGTLNFMGDGEPLMNPEASDIIHYAALHNICTVLTTNGTLLTKRLTKQWEKDKVYRVHVSVDASYKELYEELRPGAEFGKVVENLKLLGNSSIDLCVNVLLTEPTMQEMPKMARLAKDVGAKEVTYLMPICTLSPDEGIMPKASNRNQELFSDTQRLCSDLDIKWTFPLQLSPTFRRFSFPFIRPEITIEGDVYACCYSLGRGRVWFNGYSYKVPSYNMGNIFKDGFRKIWYGEGFNEIRRVYKESEAPKGTIISREELLRRTKEAMEDPDSRYAHCKVCLARWGMACS